MHRPFSDRIQVLAVSHTQDISRMNMVCLKYSMNSMDFGACRSHRHVECLQDTSDKFGSAHRKLFFEQNSVAFYWYIYVQVKLTIKSNSNRCPVSETHRERIHLTNSQSAISYFLCMLFSKQFLLHMNRRCSPSSSW